MSTADLIRLLRARQRWYAEGCDDLDDHDGYLSGGLAADAADDLGKALDALDATEAHAASLQAEGEATRQALQNARADAATVFTDDVYTAAWNQAWPCQLAALTRLQALAVSPAPEAPK